MPQGNKKRFSLDENLIAYYPLDGTAEDKGPNALAGTIHRVSFNGEEAIIGQSAFFGGNGYIEIPHNELLNLQDNFTISFWIKQERASPSGNRYIDKTRADYGNGYMVDDYGNHGLHGMVRFSAGSSPGIAHSNSKVVVRHWQHIAVTHVSGTTNFYRNGMFDGSAQQTSIQKNTLSLRLGFGHGTEREYYKGLMDEVRLYGKALSQEEISQLYSETVRLYAESVPTDQLNSRFIDAVKNKELTMAKTFLERGADVNSTVDSDNNTCLHEAVRQGNVELVRLLVVDYDADMEAKNSYGTTPIVYAATFSERLDQKRFEGDKASRKAILKILIVHGANLSIENQGGQSAIKNIEALHDSERLEFMDFINGLEKDKNSRALLQAVKRAVAISDSDSNEWKETRNEIKHLLKEDANPNYLENGWSAMAWAMSSSEQILIKEILFANGASIELAIERFHDAIRINPSIPEELISYKEALNFQREGDHRHAEANYLHFIQTESPYIAMGRYQLALLYKEMSKQERTYRTKAIAQLDILIEDENTVDFIFGKGEALVLRAKIYSDLPVYDKAMADYTSALALNPENVHWLFESAEIHENQANIFIQNEQNEEAYRLLNEASHLYQRIINQGIDVVGGDLYARARSNKRHLTSYYPPNEQFTQERQHQLDMMHLNPAHQEMPYHDELARLSQVAYHKSEEPIPEGYRRIHNSTEFGFSKEGYYGEAYQKNNFIVIVHRGTDFEFDTQEQFNHFIDDMKSNLRIAQDEVPYQWKYAKGFVEKIRKTHPVSAYRYYTTGHSLGGCLASLASYEFDIPAVTFDSPGVLNILRLLHLKSIQPQDVKVINYVSYPNIVNTSGRHCGQVRFIQTQISMPEGSQLSYETFEQFITGNYSISIYNIHSSSQEELIGFGIRSLLVSRVDKHAFLDKLAAADNVDLRKLYTIFSKTPNVLSFWLSSHSLVDMIKAFNHHTHTVNSGLLYKVLAWPSSMNQLMQYQLLEEARMANQTLTKQQQFKLENIIQFNIEPMLYDALPSYYFDESMLDKLKNNYTDEELQSIFENIKIEQGEVILEDTALNMVELWQYSYQTMNNLLPHVDEDDIRYTEGDSHINNVFQHEVSRESNNEEKLIPQTSAATRLASPFFSSIKNLFAGDWINAQSDLTVAPVLEHMTTPQQSNGLTTFLGSGSDTTVNSQWNLPEIDSVQWSVVGQYTIGMLDKLPKLIKKALLPDVFIEHPLSSEKRLELKEQMRQLEEFENAVYEFLHSKAGQVSDFVTRANALQMRCRDIRAYITAIKRTGEASVYQLGLIQHRIAILNKDFVDLRQNAKAAKQAIRRANTVQKRQNRRAEKSGISRDQEVVITKEKDCFYAKQVNNTAEEEKENSTLLLPEYRFSANHSTFWQLPKLEEEIIESKQISRNISSSMQTLSR